MFFECSTAVLTVGPGAGVLVSTNSLCSGADACAGGVGVADRNDAKCSQNMLCPV